MTTIRLGGVAGFSVHGVGVEPEAGAPRVFTHVQLVDDERGVKMLEVELSVVARQR